MSDSFEVVGGELVATHDDRTVRLSLALPLDRLDQWLEITPGGWWEMHQQIRDQIMPDSVREQVQAEETLDAMYAVELVRRWVAALNDRLGKVLSISPYGEVTEHLLQPTSGSDTDSTPTEPAPTTPPKSPRRTRSRS